jgi:hypothetical protein
MRPFALVTTSALLLSVSAALAAPPVTPATAPTKSEPVEKVAQKPAVAAPVAAPNASSGITVARAAIATGLNGYEPINPGETFPPTVKRLYCLSLIRGATDTMHIEHRWYWNDKLIATVPLAVKSVNWNTYSIKTILPDMTGEWRVSIVNAQGEQELQSLKFTVQ